MRTFLITCATLGVVSAANPASAQDLMRDMQRECMADAQKLCSTKIGNPNELIQCMVDKRTELAAGCQPVVDRAARALSITPTPPAPSGTSTPTGPAAAETAKPAEATP